MEEKIVKLNEINKTNYDNQNKTNEKLDSINSGIMKEQENIKNKLQSLEKSNLILV